MNDQSDMKPMPLPWPNTIKTREELDAALEEGLRGAIGDRTIPEQALARMRRG